MATLKMSELSTEYVRVSVATNPPTDPTTDDVSLAFLEAGTEPTDPDWIAGTWETVSGTYYARVLVGPDGHALDVGSYIVWLKVVDNPEEPVRKAGKLVIF